ncbi:hypothetical protein VCHA49P381_70129 [Vibrio chagasii]|nr:hypothetical protein VCHA49P381_70129 [Vibrio chagasii]
MWQDCKVRLVILLGKINVDKFSINWRDISHKSSFSRMEWLLTLIICST